MSQLKKLYIAATGMITPLGSSSEMTASSVKAGISAYQESAYFNKKNKPMKNTRVPDDALPELSDELVNLNLSADLKRMLRLCHAGLNDIGSKVSLELPITLVLAGPENIPARKTPVSADFLEFLGIQTGLNIKEKTSRYARTGRTGAIEAIAYAFDYLSKEGNDYILVGGVDSFLNAGLMSFLDAENRILATNINNGFAPGEAASFILLGKKYNKSFLPVSLSSPGMSKEEGHLYSEEVPYRGDGLAEAFRRSINNSARKEVKKIYSSMNGENFFVKEFGVALIRNSGQVVGEHKVEHPADCYGDLGAATGAVLITLAAFDIAQEQSDLYDYLVCCSSDLERRAAVCLSKI